MSFIYLCVYVCIYLFTFVTSFYLSWVTFWFFLILSREKIWPYKNLRKPGPSENLHIRKTIIITKFWVLIDQILVSLNFFAIFNTISQNTGIAMIFYLLPSVSPYILVSWQNFSCILFFILRLFLPIARLYKLVSSPFLTMSFSYHMQE